jgi:hypothetical protein
MLVKCDKEYQADAPSQPWEDVYAHKLIERFAG